MQPVRLQSPVVRPRGTDTWSALSISALAPPSPDAARLNRTTRAGKAQKSPQTHKMAAPIYWLAKGDRVIPRRWSYTGYNEWSVKMLKAMARKIITTLVPRMARSGAGPELRLDRVPWDDL